jgi:hypothetical protein
VGHTGETLMLLCLTGVYSFCTTVLLRATRHYLCWCVYQASTRHGSLHYLNPTRTTQVALSAMGTTLSTMSASSTAPTASDSIPEIECTPASLGSRNIAFDAVAAMRLQDTPPVPLEFHEQWTTFIEAVKALTGPVVSGRRSVPHDNVEQALNRFLKVMKKLYGNEEEFKLSLFWALRESLGELCRVPKSKAKKRKSSNQDEDPVAETGGGTIMLQNCDVGFVTGVARDDILKFPINYAVSSGSRFDLACIVFGRVSSDVTACVGLKVGHSACMDYEHSVHGPALSYDHAPLGRSLWLALDVLHCLARRGFLMATPMCIPVLVLAAKAKSEHGSEDRLCCMEGCLKIPEQLGGGLRVCGRAMRSLSMSKQQCGS